MVQIHKSLLGISLSALSAHLVNYQMPADYTGTMQESHCRPSAACKESQTSHQQDTAASGDGLHGDIARVCPHKRRPCHHVPRIKQKFGTEIQFYLITPHSIQRRLSCRPEGYLADSGLPAGELSWDLWMLWSMREATKTRIILLLTSTTSSHSRNRLQPSLRAVLITYLAFISRSRSLVPGVTTARLMHLGSTADSRSTCRDGHAA